MQENKLLKIAYKSKRSGTYEIKVRGMMEQLGRGIDLSTFLHCFESEVEKMPRMSVGSPWNFWKANMADDGKSVEVWHYNVKGDKDRLMAVVTYEVVSEEEHKKYSPFDYL